MQQPVLFCWENYAFEIKNKNSKNHFKFTLGNRAILCLYAGDGFLF